MSWSLHKRYGWPQLDAFAARRTVICGEIQLSRLARLNDLPHVDSSFDGRAFEDHTVRASLRFEQRREGWLGLELEYDARLPLVCQRCLETFVYPAAARFGIGLLDTASMEPHLPEGYEPMALEGDGLMPAQLIEDELIVALPLVPRHESLAACGGLVNDDAVPGDRERAATLSYAHKTSH